GTHKGKPRSILRQRDGMNWRNRKFLDAVRELPCAFDAMPHSCGHFSTPCHSNQIRDGKGKAIKAHDFRVAAGCNCAHIMIDSGKDLSRAERLAFWEDAHRKTIGELFLRGKLVVR
ncbi:MAG: hypothetical protein MN733_17805, partial [Nitrososphaera sp.]|nr:hypothetical protein [Nitrososphaera sp.]